MLLTNGEAEPSSFSIEGTSTMPITPVAQMLFVRHPRRLFLGKFMIDGDNSCSDGSSWRLIQSGTQHSPHNVETINDDLLHTTFTSSAISVSAWNHLNSTELTDLWHLIVYAMLLNCQSSGHSLQSYWPVLSNQSLDVQSPLSLNACKCHPPKPPSPPRSGDILIPILEQTS